jgi:hypothetical protein
MEQKKLTFDLGPEFVLGKVGGTLDAQLSGSSEEIYHKPPFKSLPSYDDDAALRAAFPAMQYVNYVHGIHEFSQSYFYVIRSKKTDDIHKAVKYGVWTSSPQNNFKISEAFKNRTNQGGNVFFFFTYLSAPGFVGLARLVDMDLKKEFPYWGEIGRWVGVMRLEWVYLRDIEFHNLTKLTEISPIDKLPRPLSDLTDGTKMSEYNAKEIIKIMNEKPETSYILKKFVGHDIQEKQLRANVEEIIRTNTMENFKRRLQKRQEPSSPVPPPATTGLTRPETHAKQPEVTEVVVKKKMTQGELKKLKKQQQQQKQEGEETAN